ncbi:hypothetical protein DBV15_06908 [Temnothorax longispinosus]|uniref:Uncharacterized protein n=1 Tax=Temnothorax longispinosus TaxID=300112 RepID=A0A4S2JBI6_9HYME|nr:hypothetical protein DBV15_06908 [Temnothorax longispinosus]
MLPWIFRRRQFRRGKISPEPRRGNIFATYTGRFDVRAFGEASKLNDLFPRWTGLEVSYGRIRQVACGPCTIAEYKGWVLGRESRTGAEGSGAGVRVLTRVFVMELMASTGRVTESIIRSERRRGKKLWFRVHRGRRGTVSPVGRKGSGLLGITTRILEHMLSALHLLAVRGFRAHVTGSCIWINGGALRPCPADVNRHWDKGRRLRCMAIRSRDAITITMTIITVSTSSNEASDIYIDASLGGYKNVNNA